MPIGRGVNALPGQLCTAQPAEIRLGMARTSPCPGGRTGRGGRFTANYGLRCFLRVFPLTCCFPSGTATMTISVIHADADAQKMRALLPLWVAVGTYTLFLL